MKTKKKKSAEEMLRNSKLTEKNKIFCRGYILDWNGARAYKVAYPRVTDHSARTLAGELLTKPEIQNYINLIQQDLEKIVGISKLKVLHELKKLAFSSIGQIHNTWIDRKEFESLTDDQKACISEIETKVKTEWESDQNKKIPVRVEQVRIKLYDKQKALDSISKMMGYDAPSKLEITNPINIVLTKEETKKISKHLENDC